MAKPLVLLGVLALLACGTSQEDASALADASAAEGARVGQSNDTNGDAGPALGASSDACAAAPCADALPSDALPSDALPSDALPSDALPSDALTSDALSEPAPTHDPDCSDVPMFAEGWDYNAHLVAGSPLACPVCSPYSKKFVSNCSDRNLECKYEGSNVGALCRCTPDTDSGAPRLTFVCGL